MRGLSASAQCPVSCNKHRLKIATTFHTIRYVVNDVSYVGRSQRGILFDEYTWAKDQGKSP